MAEATGLTVRAARPEDAAAIVAILNPIIEAGEYSAFNRPFSAAEERAYIEGLPERGLFLVATDDNGAIVGFQSMEPFATYTDAFDHVGVVGTYVDLRVRRRGVAAALFPATFEAAHALGYRKIFTYVRADNPAALAAYQAHGFRVVGTAEQHLRVGSKLVDEVVIEKLL